MTVVLITHPANYMGLSGDTKPTDCVEGSTFTETNTGKRWVYTGTEWAEDMTLIYALYEALNA